MQDVHENLYAEIMSMASVFERMDCHNSANYIIYAIVLHPERIKYHATSVE